MTAHLDAELLALCDRLREMQAEWQRLYDATSDRGPLTTPADLAWKAYSDDVWPGVRVSTWGDRPLHPDDVPGRLRMVCATTAEGKAAKARAILALEEASAYLDCRDDVIDLMLSLMRDVAGIETCRRQCHNAVDPASQHQRGDGAPQKAVGQQVPICHAGQ